MSERGQFWNDVAKYGLLLGVTMGASKIFEQSLVVYGGLNYSGWVLLEWLVFAFLFCVMLRTATKKRAAEAKPSAGFSFMQSVNYMMLISIFAAVPVSCLYYVFVNSMVGYDNYIESLVSLMEAATALQPVDASTADAVDLLISQMRSAPQGSIFSSLINTIIQYAFAGMFVGFILSGSISRKPDSLNKSNEE